MTTNSWQIRTNVVDVLNRRIFPATVDVADGIIVSVSEDGRPQFPQSAIGAAGHPQSGYPQQWVIPTTYLLPGFIDAHVHIESSMLVPAEFARAAVVHGTVAAVSDPHEIGNVLGVDGVRFMLDNAERVPFKFCFGAPSCVPATTFETAGEQITSQQVASLLDDKRIGFLSEMMNVPGVLSGDADVAAKIRAARDRGKPVDGHAPSLRSSDIEAYFGAGITTDHECFTLEEATQKLACGAKILIREGSAARNFDTLIALVDRHPDECMFCSDDKHPDELLAGHINLLVKRAVQRGTDLMNALCCACVTPVRHYGLNVGLLRPGDDADFVEVDSLDNLRVLRTFIRGQLVAEAGETRIPRVEPLCVNRFTDQRRAVEEFRVAATSHQLNVIEAIDGQLITRRQVVEPAVQDGMAVSDPGRDILKMTVVNRYHAASPAVAFVRSFGLKQGAMASSVAHDSHNIIAVGVSDEDLCTAVNLVIDAGGGLSVVAEGIREVLPLPVAGLMSTRPCSEVGPAYAALEGLAKNLGSTLSSPFMTLSFMALLVIPEIKLSDRGLFDGNRFEFMPLFV